MLISVNLTVRPKVLYLELSFNISLALSSLLELDDTQNDNDIQENAQNAAKNDEQTKTHYPRAYSLKSLHIREHTHKATPYPVL